MLTHKGKKAEKKKKRPTAKRISGKKVTPLTMQELDARGYTVAKVEYWSPFPKPHGRRHDLFNCIDVLGIYPSKDKAKQETLGVQCTARLNASARVKKIMHEPDVRDKAIAWLGAGNKLEVWGWDRYGIKARLQVIPILLVLGGLMPGERTDYQ